LDGGITSLFRTRIKYRIAKIFSSNARAKPDVIHIALENFAKKHEIKYQQ
jgi:rRNA pseudouridine-1189 N-methylase Emg1 (Nep1/Mra1 family)